MKTTKKSSVEIEEIVQEKYIDMTPEPDRDMESGTSTGRSASGTMFKLKAVNLAAVFIPFLGFIVAIVLLWGIAFNWMYLAILGVMYLFTSVGITIGYHRLFTHRSFKAPKPVVAVLAALGSMAVEGPVLQWVADHRRHHHHSDEEGDPHSPHLHDSGIWEAIKGMLHAHVGWMLRPHPRRSMRYIGDLRKDKLVRSISKQFPMWVLIGLIIPAVLGGVLTLSWTGVFLGFIWGGLVRVFLVHHMTWSINSICHIWGKQPFDTHDHSKNNIFMGVFALGEGWHNNHHAFQSSARHGLRWWEIDLSYMIICVMKKVGLAYDVRVPTKERILAKLK